MGGGKSPAKAKVKKVTVKAPPPFAPITDAMYVLDGADNLGYFEKQDYADQQMSDITNYDSWMDGLSKKEKNALKWYTGGSYYAFNDAVRKGKVDTADSTYRAKLDAINSAMAKTQIDKAISVYRGSTADLLGGASTVSEIQKLIGATVIDKAPVSTSVSKSSTFSDEIMYKIIVPPGKGRGAYVRPISQHPAEYEFLVKPESKYRIVGVAQHKKYNRPVVTLQIVD